MPFSPSSHAEPGPQLSPPHHTTPATPRHATPHCTAHQVHGDGDGKKHPRDRLPEAKRANGETYPAAGPSRGGAGRGGAEAAESICVRGAFGLCEIAGFSKGSDTAAFAATLAVYRDAIVIIIRCSPTHPYAQISTIIRSMLPNPIMRGIKLASSPHPGTRRTRRSRTQPSRLKHSSRPSCSCGAR